MKNIFIILALCGVFARAQDVSMEQQANLKAEKQMEAAYSKVTKARSDVLEAIKAIKDPQKQELYRSLFERNEKSWADFIGTTALLQQGAKDLSTKPDIRYTRVLDADYSEFRVRQYQEFSRRIGQQK